MRQANESLNKIIHINSVGKGWKANLAYSPWHCTTRIYRGPTIISRTQYPSFKAYFHSPMEFNPSVDIYKSRKDI
jgi:hypothetical protein